MSHESPQASRTHGGPRGEGPEGKPVLAVLPFVDLSPGRVENHFCEGIAEEILQSLCRVEGLRGLSRTSSSCSRIRRSRIVWNFSPPEMPSFCMRILTADASKSESRNILHQPTVPNPMTQILMAKSRRVTFIVRACKQLSD